MPEPTSGQWLRTNAYAADLILTQAVKHELPSPVSVHAHSEDNLEIVLATYDDLTEWATWAEACIDHHHQQLDPRSTRYIAEGLLLEHPVELLCTTADNADGGSAEVPA